MTRHPPARTIATASLPLRTKRLLALTLALASFHCANNTAFAGVAIDVSGPAANDGGAGAAAVAQVTQNWGLPKGAVFQQSAWDRAKVRAVATLIASPYAAARIVSSEARIDPATREATLHVGIDSGPAFRIGHLDITGLSRYSEALVRNYSTIKPGDPYSAATLDQYLR